MTVECVSLPLANRLVQDYQLGKADALQFFAHHPYEPQSFQDRLNWLRERTVAHRDQLAEGLYIFNEQIGNAPEALRQIELLKRPDTYVVIGGQQAGVLTGPLYTIHKAVHLIQAAKRLSEELAVNVVPVFWIAGEDHDIDEIDHVYWLADNDTKLQKERLPFHKKGRMSASRLPLDEERCQQFLHEFFRGHTETAQTSEIRELLEATASSASTVAEWFARLMAQLFGKHGLVLVESSLPFVRQLQRPMLRRVIEQNEKVSDLLMKAADRLESAGYQLQLQVEEHQANLFVYEGEDRLLLERHGDRFVTRRSVYSREQLLKLAEEQPERFSANVVTRGLMQEQLFPTLAFVGGPGEIAYWAYYRDVFECFGMQMPIVLPRVSVTLLEGAVDRLLTGFDLKVERVLTGFAAWRQEWEAGQEPHPLHTQFASVRESLENLYRPLVEEVVRVDGGLRGLAEKNAELLIGQVNFLEERLIRSLHQREDVAYLRLQRIEASLLPEGVLQERKLNLFSYANKYGLSLVDRLVEAPFKHDGTHQIFYV